MGGWMNVQIGQELIPVVIRSLMGPLDHSISSYRCLGHALASGITMRGCMAELFGKATGSSKGKGGMHSFQSPETRFWGGYGFVGTQTPLACGLGFALKHRGEAGAGDLFINQFGFGLRDKVSGVVEGLGEAVADGRLAGFVLGAGGVLGRGHGFGSSGLVADRPGIELLCRHRLERLF
jgi:hypothetical protein